MHPILLKIGPLNIYSYGAMVALGFAFAATGIYLGAGRFNLDRDKMLDLTILILIGGIIGARIMYVLLNIGRYISSPIEIFDLSKGGLVWYGGFLMSIAVIVLFISANKLDFWSVGDLVVPYVALAQAVGRIGCFLNGCCFGKEAPHGFFAGMLFPGESVVRYSTQLYSSVALLLIYAILRLWQERRHFAGEIFLAYCMLYSYKRVLIEFLRGDNPKIIFDLTISQVISVAVFTVACAIFIHKVMRWKRRGSG